MPSIYLYPGESIADNVKLRPMIYFLAITITEQIGCCEKTMMAKKYEADGDIDITKLILSNPYKEIAPVSTKWERSETLIKDA